MNCNVSFTSVTAAIALLGILYPPSRLLSQQAETFDSGIAQVADDLAQPLVGHTVAIFEFPDLQSRITDLSRLVSEQLTTELVKRLNGRGRVLERRQVLQVLTELNLQKTDLTAAEVSQVGRQLGADAIIIGSVTTVGTEIMVNARAVSVARGEVLTASRMNAQGTQDLLALATTGSSAPSLVRPQRTNSLTGRAETSNPAPARFRGQIGLVTVEVTQCSQNLSTVTCQLMLTNGGTEQEFGIRFHDTRLFDGSGNMYEVSRIGVANSGDNIAVLVYLVPTRAVIIFTGVQEGAKIALLEICGASADADEWSTLRFRDIPVAR